ncbi:MAG TPA: CoA transferase, partial [Dehalococcoidales bacterium]|nr:CoA transferase [Dehalococcoidales bacterium]
PNQEYWVPFCKAIDKTEWIDNLRYATMESREKNREEIIKLLDELFATRTWAEWEKSFRENDLIVSVNQTVSEILEDEQAMANNFYTDIEHPVMGKARLLNSPLQFSETPAQIKSVAPPVGAHTEEVLLELGYSWEEIASLKEDGVIS